MVWPETRFLGHWGGGLIKYTVVLSGGRRFTKFHKFSQNITQFQSYAQRVATFHNFAQLFTTFHNFSQLYVVKSCETL